ncbi:TPA: response regulator [Candidatus Bathyarchaeota archaeon]|nr:response regulator [Candidatus Bathyarchaeota archaeon]
MKPRILVVEDERDVLELARDMLESGGYTVATATSGEEALRLVEEERPDLVLLDVVLPGVSGLEVCRKLKRSPETCGVPVVVFTALGAEVDMMLEDGVKADAYLGKPFTMKALLEKVEAQLSRVQRLG